MTDELQVVSDGDGIAVVGPKSAVEKLMRSAGLWASSQELDLRRLAPLVDFSSAASDIAADSGRWVKLTEESARLVREHGLMDGKTPGLKHLLIGKPGQVANWLQTEDSPTSLLMNPAALSGLGGVMAQAAMRQTMAEIVGYLQGLDHKVDDVIRKVDDAKVADMVGAGEVIERALAISEQTATVNATLWSTVATTHHTIASTQAYALRQLDAVAHGLERTKVKDLAEAVAAAEEEVPKWLAVLARCFQLQDGLAVIEIDRVLVDSPDELDDYRRGLQDTQQTRRMVISEHTAGLLGRMDAAVNTANTKMVFNRTRSLSVLNAASRVSTGVDEFHGLVSIDADPWSWNARQLGRAWDIGSHAVQTIKDKGPTVVTVGLVLGGAVAGRQKLQD